MVDLVLGADKQNSSKTACIIKKTCENYESPPPPLPAKHFNFSSLWSLQRVTYGERYCARHAPQPRSWTSQQQQWWSFASLRHQQAGREERCCGAGPAPLLSILYRCAEREQTSTKGRSTEDMIQCVTGGADAALRQQLRQVVDAADEVDVRGVCQQAEHAAVSSEPSGNPYNAHRLYVRTAAKRSQ